LARTRRGDERGEVRALDITSVEHSANLPRSADAPPMLIPLALKGSGVRRSNGYGLTPCRFLPVPVSTARNRRRLGPMSMPGACPFFGGKAVPRFARAEREVLAKSADGAYLQRVGTAGPCLPDPALRS
jgi:hypothetical protein